MIARMPLRQAGEAVIRLRSAAPRFRIVLDTADSDWPTVRTARASTSATGPPHELHHMSGPDG
ncbi:hypothetical protein I2W78_13040 [Streptomyces spinoverrucosus]|uniref:hypothetical protein n=1 Tax=Streptomyces spinoverrucosus TaxID=284043 RepID=UPI0018C38CD8|nr:hypothetical protein [Streptomyces spinoverrucosus]MBG0852744.1 hypothetical protein [Streptomyces spinoverrucosus]